MLELLNCCYVYSETQQTNSLEYIPEETGELYRQGVISNMEHCQEIPTICWQKCHMSMFLLLLLPQYQVYIV